MLKGKDLSKLTPRYLRLCSPTDYLPWVSYVIIVASKVTEIIVVTLAITWLKDADYSRVYTVTEVRQGNLHADLVSLINQSSNQRTVWIYWSGHFGLIGNEMTYRLAGKAKLDEKVQFIFDGSSLETMVESQIANERECRPSDSYTLQCLKKRLQERQWHQISSER